MAGHRRETGRPKRSAARVESRSSRCRTRIAAAATWCARLGPSTDHVRAGLAQLARTDPAAAERIAEALVRENMRVAADLDAEMKRTVR